MAHGRPSGYTTLYDESGNPVNVRVISDGSYALGVRDEEANQKLEAIVEALTPEEDEDDVWSGMPWE